MKLETGQIVILTSGAYSDYQHHVLLKVLVSFDTHAMAQRYFKEHPEQKEEYSLETNEFIAFLLDSTFVQELNMTEWFLGEYDTYEEK